VRRTENSSIILCPKVDDSDLMSSGNPSVNPLIVDDDMHSLSRGIFANKSAENARESSSSAAWAPFRLTLASFAIRSNAIRSFGTFFSSSLFRDRIECSRSWLGWNSGVSDVSTQRKADRFRISLSDTLERFCSTHKVMSCAMAFAARR
jgi:hypothetical protein